MLRANPGMPITPVLLAVSWDVRWVEAAAEPRVLPTEPAVLPTDEVAGDTGYGVRHRPCGRSHGCANSPYHPGAAGGRAALG